MSDWTAGYVAEIDYTYGYYTELNPQRIELALIEKGIRPPKIENANKNKRTPTLFDLAAILC